jgi:hypothetical protein
MTVLDNNSCCTVFGKAGRCEVSADRYLKGFDKTGFIIIVN